ncbi:MAG TPA: polyphenol oxidase family protein [Aeromicrobium sp.]|nr:polyphenol oxidase family protein [Aeromicrobium sp.]
MFLHREVGPVEFWFTEASDGDVTDPSVLADLRSHLGVEAIATMRQVHGPDVAWAMPGLVPEADALLTYTPNLALLVRVADCVPIVLATEERDSVGVVHAGRKGLVAGVVPAAVRILQERGKGDVSAWIGPRICGRCYELDADTAGEVARAVPAAASTTARGTPGADIGAGVAAQLDELAVHVTDLGGCTLEDDRFFSYRRDGTAQRQGAIVVLR